MTDEYDDSKARADWFLKRRAHADGTFPSDLILKSSQVRHQQLREQALRTRIAFRPPGGAGSVNWTPIGPSAVRHGSPTGNPVVSGRINAIAAGPGGRVYAASANGGVWFSEDRGLSWTPLDKWFWSDPLPPAGADSLSVGTLAVKFGAQRSEDLLFVGTGEPVGGYTAYFGVGIRVSRDGGQTFPPNSLEATNLAGVGIYRIAIDPDGGTDPLALAATTKGLYRRPRSASSRDSWTEIPTDTAATDVIVAGAGPRKTYYAAFSAPPGKPNIYSSPDAMRWTPISGVTTPAGRISLAASESNPDVVYALAYDDPGEPKPFQPKLFRREGSVDFRSVALPPPGSTVPDINKLFERQGDYDNVVAVDPTDPNLLYLAGAAIVDAEHSNLALYGCAIDASKAAGPQMVYATYLGNGIHADAHCLAFETRTDGTHDPSAVWVCTDGGPFCSTRQAAPDTFVARNDGLAVTQLTYFDHRLDTDAVVVSGCQDNGTVRFWGEAAWYHAAPGDGGGVAIDPNDPRRLMRQGDHAKLMTCTDGALDEASWTSLWDADLFPPTKNQDNKDKESQNAEPYTRIRAIDAGAGETLAAFGTNRLWVTTDWGAKWTTLPSSTNPLESAPGDFDRDKLDSAIVDICLPSATLICVATSASAYRFVKNNGAWRLDRPTSLLPTDLTSAWSLGAIAVDDAAAGSFYVGASNSGSDDHVWYFDGKDWHRTRPSSGPKLPEVSVNAVTVDPAHPNVVYVGTDVGVWKGTKQSGSPSPSWTWDIFSSGLPEAAVLDLAIHPKARLLRAATHGRGAWEISLDATSGRDTDVYLRAHTADSGRRFPWAENVPDPTMPGRYATRAVSPDIRVWRNSKGSAPTALDFVGFADLDVDARMLDPTGVNRIFVQVHNRGKNAARSGDVTVCLVLASADNGVPALPADFATRIRNKDANPWPNWKFADAPYQTLRADLTAKDSQIVSFDVDLSTWPLSKGSVCAVAFVSAAKDAIDGSDANVDTALATNKFMAAKVMEVAASSPSWRPGGAMVNPRAEHTATLLRNNGVFVSGGVVRRGLTAPSAELRNVLTNAWSSCARTAPGRGTTLRDGRVLLVMPGSVTFFWDPLTGALTRGPDRRGGIDVSRAMPIRLANGMVLVVAAEGSELFDPASNSWIVLSGAPTGDFYAAVPLRDGRAVVQGATVGAPNVPLVYVFDPKTGNWTSVAVDAALPYRPSATCLDNGHILFVGGSILGGSGLSESAAATVIALDPDPINPSWRQMSPMPRPLSQHTATLLDDGTVLVVGGRNDSQWNSLSTVQRYHFDSDSWHQEPSMAQARAGHTATKLATGEVVAAGGYTSSSQIEVVGACEIYVPAERSRIAFGGALGDKGLELTWDAFPAAKVQLGDNPQPLPPAGSQIIQQTPLPYGFTLQAFDRAAKGIGQRTITRCWREDASVPIDGNAVHTPFDVVANVMAVSPDGTQLFVASGPASACSLTVLEPKTLEAIAIIPIGLWQPSAIAFSPDSSTVYLACQGNPDMMPYRSTLTVIDAGRHQITATMGLSEVAGSFFLAGASIAANKNRIFLAGYQSNASSLLVLDAHSRRKVRDPLRLGTGKPVFALSPTRLYYSEEQTYQGPDGETFRAPAVLKELDPETLTVLRSTIEAPRRSPVEINLASQIAAAADDSCVLVLEEKLYALQGNDRRLTALANPPGRLAISSDGMHAVAVLNVLDPTLGYQGYQLVQLDLTSTDLTPVVRFSEYGRMAAAMAIAGDNSRVFVATTDLAHQNTAVRSFVVNYE